MNNRRSLIILVLGVFASLGSANALSRVVFCKMSRMAPETYGAEVQESEPGQFKFMIYKIDGQRWAAQTPGDQITRIDPPQAKGSQKKLRARFTNPTTSLVIEDTEARSSSGDSGFAGQLKWQPPGPKQQAVQEDMLCWFSKRAKQQVSQKP